MLTTVSGKVGGQFRQLSLYLLNGICGVEFGVELYRRTRWTYTLI